MTEEEYGDAVSELAEIIQKLGSKSKRISRRVENIQALYDAMAELLCDNEDDVMASLIEEDDNEDGFGYD